MINRFLTIMLLSNGVGVALAVYNHDPLMILLGSFGIGACLAALLPDLLGDLDFRLMGPWSPIKLTVRRRDQHRHLTNTVTILAVNRMAYLSGNRWLFGLIIFDKPFNKTVPLEEEEDQEAGNA